MSERLTKEARDRNPAYALMFAVTLPRLQAVAREHGYALAVHGSMRTDLDLIAAPWVGDASDAETLVEALRAAFNGVVSPWDSQKSPRPHGRLAWSFYPGENFSGPYVDISVMPRQENHKKEERSER